MNALAIAQDRYDNAAPDDAPDCPIEALLQNESAFQIAPDTVEDGLRNITQEQWLEFHQELAQFMHYGERGPDAARTALRMAQTLAEIVRKQWRKDAEDMHDELIEAASAP